MEACKRLLNTVKYFPMDSMMQLAKIANQLTRMDAQRAAKMQERDQLIRQARDEGNSWLEIQHITRLSSRAIKMSLERTAPR